MYDCCINCEKRHPACQDDCPDKAKADAMLKKIKQQRYKEYTLEKEYRKEKYNRLRRK